jgi:hypothetical protein
MDDRSVKHSSVGSRLVVLCTTSISKIEEVFDLVGSGQNNRNINYFKTKLSSNLLNNTYKAKERI